MSVRGRLPAPLLRRFLRLESPLLVGRYREGLEAAVGVKSELPALHVDAAGWSPEVALEQDDPGYLGKHPLHAHAILVSVEQAKAALVHPGFGFAAEAWARATGRERERIGEITLREPLLAELHHGTGTLRGLRSLADLERFEIRFRTPSGLVNASQRLDEMKREFLASDRCWLDDAYIEEMLDLARRVRDLHRCRRNSASRAIAWGPSSRRPSAAST